MQEAPRPASVLDVRPSRLADRRDIEPITLTDKLSLIETQNVPVFREVLDTLVLSSTAVNLLVAFDLGRECNLCETSSHASLRPQWSTKPLVLCSQCVYSRVRGTSEAFHFPRYPQERKRVLSIWCFWTVRVFTRSPQPQSGVSTARSVTKSAGRIARVRRLLASARTNYLQPPAASINEPVTQPEFSDARYVTTSATSFGVPRRPNGVFWTICASKGLSLKPAASNPSV